MKKIIFIYLILCSTSLLFAQKKGSSNAKQTNSKTTKATNSNQKTTEIAPKKTPNSTKISSNNNGFCFSKSDKIADLGVGFSGYGIPIHLGGEYFFTDDLSGGLAINYSRYSYSYLGYNAGTWNFVFGGPKVNYHFNRILNIKEPKADLYAGATLGYWAGWYSDANYSGYGGYGNTVYIGLQVGGRYFFSNNIGAFAELGGGNLSAATLGLSLKF